MTNLEQILEDSSLILEFSRWLSTDFKVDLDWKAVGLRGYRKMVFIKINQYQSKFVVDIKVNLNLSLRRIDF